MYRYVACFFLSFVNSLPSLPLSTSGRNLVDASGKPVLYAGVNWPGHMEVMIPEGLQYRSVEQVVKSVKDLDLNVIRLTFATQMVDDLLVGKTSVKSALNEALGQNGSVIWRKIQKHNQWPDEITRLEV